MAEESEQYQMGWNDVIGNISRASEPAAKALAFLNVEEGWPDNDYYRGARAALAAYGRGEPLAYKGTPEVVAYMNKHYPIRPPAPYEGPPAGG